MIVSQFIFSIFFIYPLLIFLCENGCTNSFGSESLPIMHYFGCNLTQDGAGDVLDCNAGGDIQVTDIPDFSVRLEANINVQIFTPIETEIYIRLEGLNLFEEKTKVVFLKLYNGTHISPPQQTCLNVTTQLKVIYLGFVCLNFYNNIWMPGVGFWSSLNITMALIKNKEQYFSVLKDHYLDDIFWSNYSTNTIPLK